MGGPNAAAQRRREAEGVPELREPKGRFQTTVRQLAEVAMGALMHDVGDHEPEYRHAVQYLEQRFTHILRGKMKP